MIFNNLYPIELKNWYSDNWLTNVYDAKPDKKIKINNSGGKPRYIIEANRKLYENILKRDKNVFYFSILNRIK